MKYKENKNILNTLYVSILKRNKYKIYRCVCANVDSLYKVPSSVDQIAASDLCLSFSRAAPGKCQRVARLDCFYLNHKIYVFHFDDNLSSHLTSLQHSGVFFSSSLSLQCQVDTLGKKAERMSGLEAESEQ